MENKLLSKKNLLSLIVVSILLFSLVLGIYLVQTKQIFKSKAALTDLPVEVVIGEGSCVTKVGDSLVASCNTVKLKLASPLGPPAPAQSAPSQSAQPVPASARPAPAVQGVRTQTAITSSYNLVSGWNLIGLPLTFTTPQSPAQVLAQTNGQCIALAEYETRQRQYKLYYSNPAWSSFNNLTEVQGGSDLFVYCSGNATLTFSGPAYSWADLITRLDSVVVGHQGYKYFFAPLPALGRTSQTASDYLTEASNKLTPLGKTSACVRLYKFDPSSNSWVWYHKNQGTDRNFTLSPTSGYILACGYPTPTTTPTPTLTLTPTPTNTPTPTATITPTPTLTLTPTPTNIPVPTLTPTPSPIPTIASLPVIDDPTIYTLSFKISSAQADLSTPAGGISYAQEVMLYDLDLSAVPNLTLTPGTKILYLRFYGKSGGQDIQSDIYPIVVEYSPSATATPAAGAVQPSVPRGQAGDLWADIVLGQPTFGESIPGEKVNFKTAGPGGVVVDRSVRPNRVYIYDGMNSRILGYQSLGVCQTNPSSPCTSDTDCLGSTCRIQVGGETGAKKADIVLGQPSFNTSACNGDGSWQSHPNRAPASASTLCSMPQQVASPFEDGSMASLAVDPQGNLYVPDFMNNRVLKYISPFTTDTVADEVWGQDNFAGVLCNKGAEPTNSSLCFRPGWTGATAEAGVDIDSNGNLWVTDPENHRVLRFPNNSTTQTIAKTADLVLGQPNFTSRGAGSSLSQMTFPSGVRVNNQGKVYVSDRQNNRVLVFDNPVTSGASGVTFASGFNIPTGIEFDLAVSTDPTSGGIWVSDSGNKQLVLFDLAGSVKKVLFKDTYQANGRCGSIQATCQSPLGHDTCNMCDARGSVGITSDGDVIVASSNGNQNAYYYKHPIPLPTPGQVYPAVAEFYYPPFGHNYPSRTGMRSTRGLALVSNQLIVSDSQRLLFWNMPNGIADLSNNKPADGVINVNGGWVGRVAADNGTTLWIYVGDEILEKYTLPLVSGQTPASRVDLRNLKILGQSSTINRKIELNGMYVDSQNRYLWLTAAYSQRAFRMRIPSGQSQEYIVDAIIGGNDIPAYNHTWHRNCSTLGLGELCAPGSIIIDKLQRNLFVSDYHTENEGTGKLLRFDLAMFPLNNSTLISKLTSDATQVINDVQGWQPTFNSQNKMAIGGALFTQHQGKTYIYTNPITSPADKVALRDYYTQGYSTAFDGADNLYVTDMNRGRVLIYKTPS